MLAGMLRVLSDPVPTIPRGDVSAELQGSLERAMAKPGGRWPTGGDFGRSLQAVERNAGWPVTSRPDEEVPDTHRDRSSVTPALDAPPPPSFPTSDVTQPRRRGGAAPSPAGDEPAPNYPMAPTGRPAPAPVSDEPTRVWARRSAPPPDEATPTVSGRRRWWMAIAALVIVVAVGDISAVVASSGSSAPRVTSRTPRLQAPSPALGAQLAPRDVEVTSEQPTAVTIHWVDPNNGRYPFMVKLSDGSVHTTTGATETVVSGLRPTKGYCFVVGAVYGVGGEVANAAPVCVRAGTM